MKHKNDSTIEFFALRPSNIFPYSKYLTLRHINTHFVSSYGVLHKQYSFSFFLPPPPPPPPPGAAPPLPGEPGTDRCCFLGRPPPREAEGGLMVAADTGADFRLPLPVLTSSCLFRSAFVRAASSVDRSFCNCVTQTH